MTKTKTIKQAGYKYIMHLPEVGHILKQDGECSVWNASKNFAGYSLKYKNTNLEFCRGIAINEILENYKEAALWSSEIDSLTIHDLLPSLQTKMLTDVTTFVENNIKDLILSGLTSSQIGHSLWLSQNHHGAGFFDYGMDQDIEDRLMDAAHKIGEYDLWVNELNHICIQ